MTTWITKIYVNQEALTSYNYYINLVLGKPFLTFPLLTDTRYTFAPLSHNNHTHSSFPRITNYIGFNMKSKFDPLNFLLIPNAHSYLALRRSKIIRKCDDKTAGS